MYFVNGKQIDQYELTIGFFGTEGDDIDLNCDNYKKKYGNFCKWTFFFTVWIWRIHFLLTTKVMRVAKVKNLEIVKIEKVNEHYFEEIFKHLIDNEEYNIEVYIEKKNYERGIKKDQTIIKSKKDEKKEFQYFNNPHNNKENIHEQFFIIFSSCPFDDAIVTKDDEDKKSVVGYARVVVRITNNYIVILDYSRDYITLFNIDDIKNISINEGRFIILFHLLISGNKKKLLFFVNTNNDDEYKNFKTFLIHLIEFKD